ISITRSRNHNSEGRSHDESPRAGLPAMNRYAAIPWPWAALFLCIALVAQDFLLRPLGATPPLSQSVYRVSVVTLGVASLALILLPRRGGAAPRRAFLLARRMGA